MQIQQTTKFKKAYKNLHPNQRHELNKELEAIINEPTIGEPKKGNLGWLRVHKCRVLNQLTLIGYQFDAGIPVLIFVAIGSHENVYRDLK